MKVHNLFVLLILNFEKKHGHALMEKFYHVGLGNLDKK